MKKELSKADILSLLERINDELRTRNIFGEIFLVGGAALSLVYGARDSTFDIDGIFEPKNEILEIAHRIAQEKDLEAVWLNDAAKGFISPQMENDKDVYKEFSNLIVTAAGSKSLLAMKLTSARRGSNDQKDALFLMKQVDVKSESELLNLIEKYTDKQLQTAQSYFFVKEVYSQYRKNQHLKKTNKKNNDELDR